MKFSGAGNYAFQLLEEHYKKKIKKKKKKNKFQKIQQVSKTQTENLRQVSKIRTEHLRQVAKSKAEKLARELMKGRKSEKHFSLWEQKVRNKLLKSGMKFVEKTQKEMDKFPLQINEGVTIYYVPDFILDKHRFHGKKIIIEAHQNLTDEDVLKYGFFVKKYSAAYHLIMIVTWGQLRQWNEISQRKHRLFDDVWTVEDVDLFMESLKKFEPSKIENIMLPEHKVCPVCNKEANDTNSVEKEFGHRKMKNGKIISQSLCKNCRSRERKIGLNALKEEVKKSKELGSSVTRYCTECKNRFTTKLASQAFCNSCLKKFVD